MTNTPDTDTPARAQTARELDRAIAEHLGWTDLDENDWWDDDVYYFELKWDGVPPNGNERALIPHFRTNANLMTERIANEHLQIHISPQMDGTFYVWINWSLVDYEGHAATIPAAFWEAYFKYTEATAPPPAPVAGREEG